MIQHFEHYSQVPTWMWPKNFSPETDPWMYCPLTNQIQYDVESFYKLQRLRDIRGEPTTGTSGYRSEIHNARVGGSPTSQHFKKIAFDLKLGNTHPHRMEAVAREAGFTGIGRYPTRGFIHVDCGPPRLWYGTRQDKELWHDLHSEVDIILID